jgi:uncharacterized protein YegJ (DUF2314 family)
MQHHRIAAALVLFSVLACSQPLTERARDEGATSPYSERAQATLDDFLTKAKQQPAGTSGYALKVKIQDGHGTEYFWVNEFTWSDGSFTGRINDEPRLVRSVKAGEIVRFSRSQVADWKYVDDKTGKTMGHFTSRAKP